MRAAIAEAQKSRDKAAAETEVRRLEATLNAVDARVVEARRARDREREPLAKALRNGALAAHWAEAAQLLRAADQRLQAARHIISTIEAFTSGNGLEMAPLAVLLPEPVAHIAERLEARS